MKWGLRIFGVLDLLTFLIFIPSKISYLVSTFAFAFSIGAKTDALWQITVLLLFVVTAFLLWFKPKTGLFFSFLLIPFRIVFIYYSLDFLSFLVYAMGFVQLASNIDFQLKWMYLLFCSEAARYLYSFYAYYKFSQH